MLRFAPIKCQVRVSLFSIIFVAGLFFSVFSLAQLSLTFRLVSGYFLSNNASTNKDKPTLFVFEQADTFEQVFQPATTLSKRPDILNFAKDMVVGIALPATNKPPKLSVSKVFVQDSTLTVRYIRMTDTTATADRATADRLATNPQSLTTQPVLLIALPKQAVLKTKLVENGRVVQTLRKEITRQ